MFDLIKIRLLDETLISAPSQATYIIYVERGNGEKYAVPLYFRWRHGWFAISHLVDKKEEEALKREGYKIIGDWKHDIVSCPLSEDAIALFSVHRDLIELYSEYLVEGLEKYENVEKAVKHADWKLRKSIVCN